MQRIICVLLLVAATPVAADEAVPAGLDPALQERCLSILRKGLRGDDFWPSIHAAEGLTIGGCGDEVIAFLAPKLATEVDDQRRCGIARELVRAGDRTQEAVMLAILERDDDHGHVHAAESLYKICAIGDGKTLRRIFAEARNLRLKIMAAGALARCGNPQAMAYLRDMLADDDPDLCKLSAWILGRIGDESDVARLQAELRRCSSAPTRAHFEHSLAALGDAYGKQRLLENLRSSDPAIRTYAATFAGDARAVEAVESLIGMLDDPHPDARYRAAQSLLDLHNQPDLDVNEDISVLVYPSTQEHPRYTEGSILELKNGSLLFAVTEFSGSGSDFAAARIVARRSTDGGRTWGEQTELQANTGSMNCMSVTLRRLSSDQIAMFYLQKDSPSDLNLFVRFSSDEAQTFGKPIRVTHDAGYHVVNNDRITQLSTGRLLAPTASTPDVQRVNHFVSRCYLSDDAGQTWRRSSGHVDTERRGAMEPEVLELRDGRVLMIVRTQLGYIGSSYSSDGGDSWSDMESLGLEAPESPATLRRIPSTGDLLLIWNNTFEPGVSHGGRRTPLAAALSSDEGQTWRTVGDLESDRSRTYAYTSLTFVQNRAVMSYWERQSPGHRISSRFRSFPVSTFYD